MLIAVTTADGQPAVLKVCYPDAQPRHEAAALCRWAGHGAAALLRAHPDRGLLLLEQLTPHRSLRAEDDAAVLPIAARVLRQLWVPPRQHSFPEQAARVRHWLTLIPGRYHQLGRPFEPDLLHAALAAARDLTAATSRPVILHGDFHRGNVLASARAGWLAIDPCPLAGDPSPTSPTSQLTLPMNRSGNLPPPASWPRYCPISARPFPAWIPSGYTIGCWPSASSLPWTTSPPQAAENGISPSPGSS